MIGRTISHYRIIGKLGGGGMGVVYEAEDLKLGRRIALKFLPDQVSSDESALHRFHREARPASALNHPNICTIYAVDEHDGRPFIAMELLSGVVLADRIAGKPLPNDQIVKFGIELANALQAAHSEGILHRDVKPGNVFVTRREQTKLLDFGLAKSIATRDQNGISCAVTVDNSLTIPGLTLGTLGYMSPEQARGEELDERSDIFSLGAVLYEMATGVQPFPGKTAAAIFDNILHHAPVSLVQLNPTTPEGFERIITKALEKDREKRYPSAAELEGDLRQLSQRGTTDGNIAAPVGEWIRQPQPPPVPIGETAGFKANKRSRLSWSALITLLGLVSVIGVLMFTLRSRGALKVTRIVQITNDGVQKFGVIPPILASDGPRLYFTEATNPASISQVSSTGGNTVFIPAPFKTPSLFLLDISLKRSEILFTAGLDPEGPLWTLPLPGGSAERVGNLMVTEATWSPDGQSIAYGKFDGSNGVHIARSDGSESHKIATTEKIVVRPRWSPDGKVLRFTQASPSTETRLLWEVSADGSNLHPLFPGNDHKDCCGVWTPDGKYFIYQSTREGITSLWAINEGMGFFRKTSTEPVQLTTGPLTFMSPSVSIDGQRVFALGIQNRGELMRYDTRTGQFVPYLSGVSAEGLDFSRDGEWLTYVAYPEGTLWRSRVDGTQRLQLTDSSLSVGLPQWSPDGRQIAFTAKKRGGDWKIYIISAEGGTPEQLIQGAGPETDPTWSPDGSSLAFGGALFDPGSVLHLLDLKTHRISTLPGSTGLLSPHWAPDGRSLVAISHNVQNSQRLMSFEFATQRWEQLALGKSMGSPRWSRKGDYVHFYDYVEENTPFYRVRISDRKLERMGSVNLPRGMASGQFGQWMGLAPHDSPLMLHDTSIQEIYALDLQLP
jgi:serine/threonine protein kinase/Tol biopolymer transport system component